MKIEPGIRRHRYTVVVWDAISDELENGSESERRLASRIDEATFDGITARLRERGHDLEALITSSSPFDKEQAISLMRESTTLEVNLMVDDAEDVILRHVASKVTS